MPETKGAAKKAAKKVAAKKSAAKKSAAKKSAAKKSVGPGRDTLRAYEHLGRVQALASVFPDELEDAKTVTGYAEQALRGDASKDAAELLRAAEHLVFGSMQAASRPDQSLSEDLLDEVREEYGRKSERAEEHGACHDAPPPIRAIYRRTFAKAAAALKEGRFRAALELVRGAEALTHASFTRFLPAGRGNKLRQVGAGT